MNRTRMLVLAFFSLLLSVLVTVIGYRVLRSRLNPTEETTEIVVAAQKLSLGMLITEQHVRTIPWPREAPLAGSFVKPEDVIGRGVIGQVAPNEPILDSKLAPKDGGGGLTWGIPEGLRAVAVRVNQVVNVAGFVLPGTRVDVILTGSPGGQREQTSKVILENVRVLSAGHHVEEDVSGEPQDVTVVTLLVTPEDSQKVALASVAGRIQLALRNPLDVEQVDPAPIRRASLYRQSSAPPATRQAAGGTPRPGAAPPPPPLPMTVELIQGNQRQTWTFQRNRP